ncbi:MAG: hypothetical protein RR277_05015, partial [Rikenellaceae bacterium]
TALLANPITWVVVGIVALIAAVVICWQKFAEFRAGVLTAWDVIKGFGIAIFDGVTAPFRIAIETIGGVVKALKALMSGDFSGAWSAIKESLSKDMDIALKPYKTIFNTVSSTKESYNGHLKNERAKDKTPKKDNPKRDNPKNLTPSPIGLPIFQPTTQNELQNKDNNPRGSTPYHPSFTIEGYNSNQTSSAIINKNSVIDSKKIDNTTTDIEQLSNRSNQTVKVDYAPVINISAEMTRKSKDDLMATLKNHAAEITRIVKEEMRKDDRTTYSYGVS